MSVSHSCRCPQEVGKLSFQTCLPPTSGGHCQYRFLKDRSYDGLVAAICRDACKLEACV